MSSALNSRRAWGGPGRYFLPLTDLGAWLAGLVTAAAARHEFALTADTLATAALAAMLAGACHLLVGRLFHLYRGRHRTGSFDEVHAVTVTAMVSAAALLSLDLAVPTRLVPASSPVVGGACALILMLAVRYLRRLCEESALRPDPRTAAPTLLFGAGAAGQDLLRAMLHDPTGAYLPVGLLDDDPSKRHLRVQGVRVLGGRTQLAAAIQSTGATTVICAVSRADAGLIREVRRRSLAAGARFQTLPSVSELLDGEVRVADVRDPDVADLLGRRQLDADPDGVARFLRGRRVLVTGAGGSIGSELCRQIKRFNPAELIMVDRDESALHAVQLSLHGHGLLDDPELVLADLRDAAAVRQVFAARQPDIVFHAAALKHVPLLQRYPGEAVQTNVWGTQTVLELAEEVGTFVNISTDKAASPSNVLGYSKRITERLVAAAAPQRAGTFLSVRFGNVLGSRGSALATFQAQIAAGGPVTVTHPEVTRYLMTIHEAVQLVLQAATIGRPGEALVLDMGQPVRITELVTQLAERAQTSANIVYTGLRPGEKLHEVLFGPGEEDLRPLHPQISHVSVPPLDPAEISLLDPSADPATLVADLARLCQLPAGVVDDQTLAMRRDRHRVGQLPHEPAVWAGVQPGQ